MRHANVPTTASALGRERRPLLTISDTIRQATNYTNASAPDEPQREVTHLPAECSILDIMRAPIFVEDIFALRVQEFLRGLLNHEAFADCRRTHSELIEDLKTAQASKPSTPFGAPEQHQCSELAESNTFHESSRKETDVTRLSGFEHAYVDACLVIASRAEAPRLGCCDAKHSIHWKQKAVGSC